MKCGPKSKYDLVSFISCKISTQLDTIWTNL